MKLQPSEAAGFHLPSTGLSACVLGLVLCPFAYIAIGALAGFAPALSFLTLPPLIASTGYLLYRFLAKPTGNSSSRLLLLAEIISWLLIAAFLVVVSNFTLLTGFERIGLFSTLFLVTALVSLPAVLVRRTALEARLRRLPDVVALLLLLVILLMAAATMAVYLLRPPAFP
ncbi:MAG: hypothetical protein R3F37_15875 [Candidatus Competibacteraceae bacterium]